MLSMVGDVVGKDYFVGLKKDNGTFIGNYSSANTTNGIFTTSSNTAYGLIMIVATDKSIVVKAEEVKE